MTSSHRSHRRRKKAGNATRIGVLGGITGVVGVAAVAALIIVVRPDGHQDPTPQSVAARSGPSHASGLAKIKTGTKFDVSTPEGYSYSLAAVKGGIADKPLSTSRTPPPRGSSLAYIDYVLTNNGSDQALLDFPADLFIKRGKYAGPAGKCMTQPGAPDDMCTPADHTDVVDTLGFKAPTVTNGDQFIPAGASYLVRVATDLPVAKSTEQSDLGLYVWSSRFIPDRQAVRVVFP